MGLLNRKTKKEKIRLKQIKALKKEIPNEEDPKYINKYLDIQLEAGLIDELFYEKEKEILTVANEDEKKAIELMYRFNAGILDPSINIEKEMSTLAKVPWVGIKLELNNDSPSLSEGSYSIDWNQIFIDKIQDANVYIGDTENDIVDHWFSNINKSVEANRLQHEDRVEEVEELPDGGFELPDGRVEYK